MEAKDMNLFQSVLWALTSNGRISINEICKQTNKRYASVFDEITRLKKTSFIGNWILFDRNTDMVALAVNLRGTPVEALEFLVKQFYKYDKFNKKGLFASSKNDNTDIAGKFEEEVKKDLESKFDFSSIAL